MQTLQSRGTRRPGLKRASLNLSYFFSASGLLSSASKFYFFGEHITNLLARPAYLTDNLALAENLARGGAIMASLPGREGGGPRARATILYSTVLPDNKKVSYCKEIARQHLYKKLARAGAWSSLENFSVIKFDHHAKFGCCVSYCVGACRRCQKLVGAGAPLQWDRHRARPC